MAPPAFLAETLKAAVAGAEKVAGGHPEVCQAHEWVKDFDSCPYGWAGWGDVTWPDYEKAKRLGAPVFEEFDAPPAFLYLCVVWSYVPYCVAGLAVLRMFQCRTMWLMVCADYVGPYFRLRRHGTKEISYALFLLIIVGFNELLFKRLVSLPRPEMSCLLSCGMPSSHAALAAGTLILGLLDFSRRCSPRQATCMLSLAEARGLPREPDLPGSRSFKQFMRMSLYDSIFSLQLAPFDEPSVRDLLGYASVWCLLMLPVPFSRIQLSDHTPTQACAGVCLGCICAVLWYLLLHGQQKRYNHLLGERWPPNTAWAFEHNYALPCSSALFRCNPYSIGPRSGSEDRFQRHQPKDAPGDPPFRWLLESMNELEWYRQQTLQRKHDLRLMGTLMNYEENYLRVRHCRIQELLDLLILERWLAEALPEDTEASDLRRFLARLTAPAPEGLGVASREELRRRKAQELRAAWRQSWEDDRRLLEHVCTLCERAKESGCDGMEDGISSISSSMADFRSSISMPGGVPAMPTSSSHGSFQIEGS